MGLSLAAALLATSLSLYWQSTGFKRRSYLEPYRLEARLRATTTYALATLLLFAGFFLAGVPLGNTDEVANVAAAPTTQAANDNGLTPVATLANVTPASGAFGGPPPTRTTTPATPTLTLEATAEVTTPLVAESTPVPTTPIPNSGATITATTAPTDTATPTPTATVTPTATPTPTPITEPTARVNTGGGTLWVRRTPGGDNIALINHNAVVILGAGHASLAGVQWQEIMTVDGVIGWVQREFLDFTNQG